MSQLRNAATKSISAENTWTDWLPVRAGSIAEISLAGVASSTVKLQRRFDGATASTVKTYTTVAQEQYGPAGAAHEIRIGVDTGGYGSDTVVAGLYVG